MNSKLGVIGSPLSHSISPAVHQTALNALDINARFEIWETTASELPARLNRMRETGCLGASVTIPHKETVVPLLDDVSSDVDTIGAVNCIVVEGKRLVGHNTDGDGFMTALAEHAHFETAGKRALLIGAGGAAKALAHALVAKGGSILTIANRTRSTAEVLAKATGGNTKAISLDAQELADVVACVDLIVNSTSVGMSSGQFPMASPMPLELIPSNALVNDIVYSPLETPLIKGARTKGARVLGGLPMLIYQGAIAFELWTGLKPPLEDMFSAGERALTVHSEE